MQMTDSYKKPTIFFIFLLTLLALGNLFLPQASAQMNSSLPLPGTMVNLSSRFAPPQLKGIQIDADNPLKFNFLIDQGTDKLSSPVKEEEYNKLIKYFLVALTIPEEELWVNLSPYEQDRIIPDQFGQTEMGRDLLAQDYLLKQLSASLLYPEQDLGKEFWDRVFQEAYQRYGNTRMPVNTFNKIWIVPDEAMVYEKGDMAFLVHSHLKVMLEEDYLALNKNKDEKKFGMKDLSSAEAQTVNDISSRVVREVILPAIEKEVNEGQNFATLRQITSSLILATWYKKTLKESLLAQVYVDRGKVKGVDLANDKAEREKIYGRYVEAFKKGVYNYIRQDNDPGAQRPVQRRYFSGGYTTKIADTNLSDRMEIVNTPEAIPAPYQAEITSSALATSLEQAEVELGEVRAALPKEIQDLLKASYVDKMTLRSKAAFSSPVMAEVPLALSPEEIAQFGQAVPYWDWQKAAEVPWEELVRNPEIQPDYNVVVSYGEKQSAENQKRYWDNQVAVRTEFLKLMKEMAVSKNPDFTVFKDRVAEMNKILLTGKEGGSIYFPPTMELNHGPREAGFIQRKLAGNFTDQQSSLFKMRMAFDTLKYFMSLDSRAGQVEREDVIRLAGDFYRSFVDFTPDESRGGYVSYEYPFFQGNTSLFMNMANAMLRLHGLKGISHGEVEYVIRYGLSDDSEGVGSAFEEYFRQRVKAANPEVAWTNTPGRPNQSSPITGTVDKNLGGIDLAAINNNLQIKRDGQGTPLPLPEQDIPNINIEGLIPIIINISPVKNLPLLLGLADLKDPQLSSR